jgi:hypothetical protein
LPQFEDLAQAIIDADDGKFATPDEVKRVFAKYGG